MTIESASRTHSDFRFGDPAPTRKQFGYARSLGVRIADGMTKEEVSIAIDKALPPTADDLKEAAHFDIPVTQGMSKWDVMSAIIDAEEIAERNGPADEDQLEEIKEMRGVLPRRVTYAEAEAAIEYLDNLDPPDCEKCGFPTCLDDDKCMECGTSFRKRRFHIPEKALIEKPAAEPEPSRKPAGPGVAARAAAGTGRLAVKTSVVGAKTARGAAVVSAKGVKTATPIVRKHSVAAARKADVMLRQISGGDPIVYWSLLGFGAFIIAAFLIVFATF